MAGRALLARLPRITPRQYRRITFASIFLLGGIIVTGGAVRITGSGLGCTDWPMCHEDSFVAPLEYHAMVEFVNRTFTGIVSLGVIVAVLGSLARVPRRRDLVALSLGLVGGVIAQIILGGITVLVELNPISVMAHFLLSIVILTNALFLHHRASYVHDDPPPLSKSWLGRALVVTASAAVLLGTVVTGSGPHGGSENIERLPFTGRDTARAHSIAVWVFVAVAVALAARVPAGEARRRATQLLAVVVAQGAIGYAQYFNGLPVLLVGLHILGATLMWIAVIRLWLSLPATLAEPGTVPFGIRSTARLPSPE